MSGETILLGGIFIGMIGIVLLAHWIDRRIVRKIELYEDRMVEQGIYKRHFTDKGKNELLLAVYKDKKYKTITIPLSQKDQVKKMLE